MPKTRIQLDVSEKMLDLIDDLVEDTGAATRAELIRRSLSIYALLLKETKASGRVEISKGNRRVRLLLVG